MLVVAIDVGGPEKIGWAGSNECSGTAQTWIRSCAM